MRVKKFIAFGIIIMVVITAILLAVPFLSLEYSQEGDQKTIVAGESFFLYSFSDGAVYTYINGTPTLLQQTGVIKLTYDGSSIIESLAVSGPPYVGHPSNFTYTQLFKMSDTLESVSGFAQTFINSLSRSDGGILSLDGSAGVVSGTLSYPYHIPYSGANQTIAHYASSIGYTQPFVVALNNFNETGSSENVPFGNYYCYDYAGSTNILVSMHLVAGTSGISHFLEELIGYTNVNKPVIQVVNFNMQLIGTNTVLSPLDLGHYLEKFLLVEILVWIIGVLYLATTVKMAKRRMKPKTGSR